MHIVHDCFVATLSLVKFLHYSSGSKQLLLLVQGLSLKLIPNNFLMKSWHDVSVTETEVKA